MRRARVRIEQDRHFKCEAGRPCRAPALRRRLASGRTEGTCVPRKTWWVRFMVKGKRYSEGYPTKEDAEARRVQVSALIDLHQDPTRPAAPPRAPLFRDITGPAFIDYRSTRTLRAATIANHESYLTHHLVPFFGAQSVDAIDRDAVRRFIAALRGVDGRTRRLSDATIGVALLPTLRIILDYAVEKKYIAQNPMRGGARLWRAEQRVDDVDPFTPDELEAIVRASYAIHHDFGVCVQIMTQCGLRPGEALALRRCDVDLGQATVHVRGTFSRGRMGPAKTRSSVRVVSLVRHEVIANPESVLPQIKAMTITGMAPDARLFDWTGMFFARRWTWALTRAGVRYRKPHALRHSFASIRLSRGANLLDVQQAGGWRSATTLLNVYAKWIREAAEGVHGASTGASSRGTASARRATTHRP